MVDKIINKQDIVQFINQEKKKPNISDIQKVFRFFLKIMNRSCYDIYLKLKNINNLNLTHIIKCGSDLIWHVFWVIYSYSFNIKLTMFLSERCILLFTEFIIMSRNPILNNDLCFIPNTNDAMQFSIKKTIGPLKIPILKSLKIKETIFFYKSLTYDYKFLLQQIFEHILNHYFIFNNNQFGNEDSFELIDNEIIKCNDDIIELFENIINIFNKPILNIYNSNLNKKNIVFFITKDVFQYNCDLSKKLTILRIYLDILLNNDFSKKINFELLLLNFKKIIFENLDDLNLINYENIQNLKKKKIYKKLILSFT